jgi:C4-type Zn-finger protein
MDHQKEAGVFTTVSGLVEQLTDNPAAKMKAQEIAQRVQQAQQQRTANQSATVAG